MSESERKKQQRTDQGFLAVSKRVEIQEPQNKRSFSRRPPPVSQYRPKTMESFELLDGLSWDVDVSILSNIL